jgi:hypothetical protein
VAVKKTPVAAEPEDADLFREVGLDVK